MKVALYLRVEQQRIKLRKTKELDEEYAKSNNWEYMRLMK